MAKKEEGYGSAYESEKCNMEINNERDINAVFFLNSEREKKVIQ